MTTFAKRIKYVPTNKFRPSARINPYSTDSNSSTQNSFGASGSGTQENALDTSQPANTANFGERFKVFVEKFQEGLFISSIDDKTMSDDRIILKFADSFLPSVKEMFSRSGPAPADLILSADTNFMSCHPSTGYDFFRRASHPNLTDHWVEDIQWRDRLEPLSSYLVWSSNLNDESNRYYSNFSAANWRLTCYLDYSKNFKYNFSLKVSLGGESEKEYVSPSRFLSLAPAIADPKPLGKCASPGAKFSVSTYEEYKCSDLVDSVGEPEYWKFGNSFTLFKWRRDFSVNQPACDAFSGLYNEVESIGRRMVTLSNSILFNTPVEEAREKRAMIEELRNQQDIAKINAEKRRTELEAICNFRR